MRIDRSKVFTAILICFVAVTSASYAHAATFTIGGTVAGLTSGTSVTLLDNGAGALKVTANGKFTFVKAVASGAAYSVTVSVQPTGETCVVTAGSGTVGAANVTTVKVACKAATFTIGGTVSGLITGRSGTLLNNGATPLKITKNGAFTFTKGLTSGSAYKVTISVQPAGETCTVTAGSGTVGTANVTTVKVACTANTYTIGGTLSGLSTGASVTLLDNAAGPLKVSANGAFTFATPVVSGAAYKVTVSVQPTGETCTVTKGTGKVLATNVTTVVVACKSVTHTIGGTLSGLTTGSSVTLLDNGADSLVVSANGKFTFKTALASGAAYSVTVSVQPTGETCTVTAGSGTVGTANVIAVKVACKAGTFTIGGTVSGLSSGASVTLLDNGTGALKVTANGAFTFATALASGAAYAVTVSVQPTGETCTVTAGSGTVGSANVTTVKVACATAATFTIGGTVSGLSSGTSVTLLDNGSGALKVAANGTFTFATALAGGATYSVTVSVQPTGETCAVTGGSGTVGSANVTTVKVACSAGGGGGSGAYWIPYSATPSGAKPAGSTGLFIIPSDKLSSSPAPTFVTTDANQLLGIGTQIAVKSGVVIYSPQVMMYADTTSAGITKIFGLTLAGTSTVPTPVQISNLSLPKTQQICQIGSSSSSTDITQPTTMFVLLEVGTAAQCSAGTGSFEVIHYLDSATTAPVVVNVNTAQFDSVYQDGKLTGLLLVDSTTNSLEVYADDTFKSPTQKITAVNNANQISSVLDAATLSTSALFYSVTTTASATGLYRIDGASLAATLIQNVMTGSIGGVIQDDTNLYYMVLTPGASSSITATFEQVALTGGTPKLLYTAPAYTNTTSVSRYQLIGSNDSLLAFQFGTVPITGGLQDPTKATATIYTVPVGTTTTTPATLATYPAGDTLVEAFLAAPSGDSLPSSIVFVTVRNASGSASAPTIAYSAVSIPLNGGAAAKPIANSVYAPLVVVSARLFNNVWQVTNITDTNGGFGGGTANVVNVSNLTDTPFTTTGGGDYVFAAGFSGGLEAVSSNNIAIGFLNNSAAAITGTATLQEIGAAADLTSDFFYPVILPNTYVLPY